MDRRSRGMAAASAVLVGLALLLVGCSARAEPGAVARQAASPRPRSR